MTDTEYLEALRTHNDRFITKLYDELQPICIRTMHKIWPSLSNDELTETYISSFTALWENVQRGKLTEKTLTAKLSAYLLRIFSNKLKHNYGLSKKEALVIDGKEIPDIPEEEEDEKTQQIREIVNNMQEPCNSLLGIIYWDDEKSYTEIAQELDYKNADSVKTQKYKCMQKLKAACQKIWKL